ncbi:MAG: hypothetical protein ACP5HS_13125 [Anaerolineae bacterium]
MSGTGPSRWDWLLASVVVATLASMLHWSVRRQAELQGSFWSSLQRFIENPWVLHSARLIYAIGFPAVLLFWQRALTSRGLGLQPLPFLRTDVSLPDAGPGTWLDWAKDIGWAVLIVGVTAAAFALGGRRSRTEAQDPPARSVDPLIALREAVYHQVHWAFYREPFVLGFGLVPGSWLGSLPVLLETVINPMFWESSPEGDALRRRQLLIRAALFVAGTQVFLTTQNLWLTIAADAALGWAFLPARAASAATHLNPVPPSTDPVRQDLIAYGAAEQDGAGNDDPERYRLLTQ